MPDRVEEGRHWIEQKLGELAAQLGLIKDHWRSWGWHPPIRPGEKRERYGLVIDVQRERRTIDFTVEDLVTCADPGAAGEDHRLRIEARLRGLLEGAGGGRKAGG